MTASKISAILATAAAKMASREISFRVLVVSWSSSSSL